MTEITFPQTLAELVTEYLRLYQYQAPEQDRYTKDELKKIARLLKNSENFLVFELAFNTGYYARKKYGDGITVTKTGNQPSRQETRPP